METEDLLCTNNLEGGILPQAGELNVGNALSVIKKGIQDISSP